MRCSRSTRVWRRRSSCFSGSCSRTTAPGCGGRSRLPTTEGIDVAGITLDEVYKVYPDGTQAVTDAHLEIPDGALMVLVGPSGCGKTTILRMVAGLEEITAGQVRIGERVVNDVAPKNRDIAMVFQNYALYPHMSVYDNMAFGLKLRRTNKAMIRERVERASASLGLDDQLKKKPRALS